MQSTEELRERLQRLSPTARALLLRELRAIDGAQADVGVDEVAVREALAELAEFEHPRRPRVVVTGMGAITPVGLTAPESWEAFVAGQSGVGPVTQFDATLYPTHFGAEVKGFDPTRYIPRAEARRMARCSQFSVVAAREALADAGLDELPDDGFTTGVVIGTGLG
ncbi:MAG: hypothetical protein J7M34_13780, partial [Anaerolineae bacterium]|nr:hypothetical protein [Anaerolineae bacterium]